jgi:hypothetical protein
LDVVEGSGQKFTNDILKFNEEGSLNEASEVRLCRQRRE